MSPEQKKEEDKEEWRKFLSKYTERLGGDLGKKERVDVMDQHNPTFILRNWIAQDAIEVCMCCG